MGSLLGAVPPLLSLFLFLVATTTTTTATTIASQSSNNGNVSSSNQGRGRELGGLRRSCNFFSGRWVYSDFHRPLYDSSCPFIDPEFNCLKYGRPDNLYTKYRWKPRFCDLPEFNGLEFLRKWWGKKIMFVGDSLSLNQFQSLTCMIYASVPNARTSVVKRASFSSVTFSEFGVTVMLHRTPYIVDMTNIQGYGRVLILDSIRSGRDWRGMDVLIFNTWHWWTHTGNSQPWNYIQEKGKKYKDMNRLLAYYKGLTTWARWVNANVDPSKTKVFYQGVSPTHYQGKDWNKPLQTCGGQRVPFSGGPYPAGKPLASLVVDKVLSRMKKPVYLLDITSLSEYRLDAHPSYYGVHHGGKDCSHWCLPGVPDTWNQLLYAALR